MRPRGVGSRAWTLVALVAMSALVLLPGSALAKKKHKKKPINLGPVVTVTAVSNVVSSTSEEATATATCPAGLGAVSGGFSSPISPGTAIVVHDSYLSSPTSWTVSGHDLGGSGGVTSTVYCRNTSRAPVADVTATVPINNYGTLGTASPSCPGTSRLIVGGFQSTTGTNSGDVLLLRTNMSTSATTWTVTALNLESSEPFTLTGHAYCMNGIPAATILSSTNSTSAVQYSTVEATTTASCPVPVAKKPKKKSKKKRKRKKLPAQLLSAGGFSNPSSPTAGPQGVVSDSRIADSGGWFGRAVNATNGTGNFSMTVQGICL